MCPASANIAALAPVAALLGAVRSEAQSPREHAAVAAGVRDLAAGAVSRDRRAVLVVGMTLTVAALLRERTCSAARRAAKNRLVRAMKQRKQEWQHVKGTVLGRPSYRETA